jgi:thiol:disulfide interchange protein
MKRIELLATVDPLRRTCCVTSTFLAIGLFASLAPPACAIPPPARELLEPERAFSVSARLVDVETLELRYTIADGYYMYRDRFRFTVNGQPVSLAPQAWPAGKWKQDAMFGKVVTYRGSVHLRLPATFAPVDAPQAGPKSITLITISQGCADAGVCYPPLRQTLVLIPGSTAWVRPRDESSSAFLHGVLSGKT